MDLVDRINMVKYLNIVNRLLHFDMLYYLDTKRGGIDSGISNITIPCGHIDIQAWLPDDMAMDNLVEIVEYATNAKWISHDGESGKILEEAREFIRSIWREEWT